VVAVEFDHLGFAPAYDVEIDPEFPPSGEWGIPEFRFGRKSADTLTIRVTPHSRSAWVASFSLEVRGQLLNGLYACPNPEHLLVAAGDEAYLTDVSNPADATEVPPRPVRVIRRVPGTDLVIIGSFTRLAAVDSSGLRCVSDRLFLDDLDLVDGPPGNIYVRGSVQVIRSEPVVLSIDPTDGTGSAEQWDRSFLGPFDKSGWRRDGV
jgi:hypothetical protein